MDNAFRIILIILTPSLIRSLLVVLAVSYSKIRFLDYLMRLLKIFSRKSEKNQESRPTNLKIQKFHRLNPFFIFIEKFKKIYVSFVWFLEFFYGIFIYIFMLFDMFYHFLLWPNTRIQSSTNHSTRQKYLSTNQNIFEHTLSSSQHPWTPITIHKHANSLQFLHHSRCIQPQNQRRLLDHRRRKGTHFPPIWVFLFCFLHLSF